MSNNFIFPAKRNSPIDMHLHTSNSDGEDDLFQVVKKASDRSLSVIAITDHDHLSLTKVEKYNGVIVIPGIELTCQYTVPESNKGSIEIHIVGLFPDNVADPSSFDPFIQKAKAEYKDYGKAVISSFCIQTGRWLTYTEVKTIADRERIGRYEIALALIKRGWATDINSALEMLSLDVQKCNYMDPPSLEEAVKLILMNGGIPVLAHPLSYDLALDELEKLTCRFASAIRELGFAANNLVLGDIEVFYEGYEAEQISFLKRLSRKHGLLPSAGSDRHGDPQPFGTLGEAKLFHQMLLAKKIIDSKQEGIIKYYYPASKEDPMDKYTREFIDRVHREKPALFDETVGKLDLSDN